jgi:catechol-2,3-dioxygenase
MPSIDHIVETAIYVDDLSLAKLFYERILGLRKIGEKEGRHVFFEVRDSVLLVFNAKETEKGSEVPPHGASGAGHFALGIQREEIDAWRQRLIEHEVEIESEADWHRGGQSLYFRDPSGNSVELVTPGCWGLASGW